MFIGKHVLRENRFLLENLSLGGHVLHNGMSIKRSYVTGKHVLWVNRFYMNEWFEYYWKTCFSGCVSACLMGSHELLEM